MEGIFLKGKIHIQAVGGENIFAPHTRLVPPLGKNPVRACWKIQGKIQSKNAGDITLENARFNPLSRQIEGFGENAGLGRVVLSARDYCQDEDITDEEVAHMRENPPESNIADQFAAFIGKVKILGQYAGNNTISDFIYSNMDGRLAYQRFASVMDTLGKNIFLLSRNMDTSLYNEHASSVNEHTIPQLKTLRGILFFINHSESQKTIQIDRMPSGIRSIIGIGVDFALSSDVTPTPSENAPRAIIAIKNQKGMGGNLFIHKSVSKIFASLVMEGTIYSGESPTNIYNDTPEELANIPGNQLYIFGTMISRNTIGGASTFLSDVKCPYNMMCARDSATQYDLNYFRNFDARNLENGNPLNVARGYKDASLDAYSLIIEYDPRIVTDMPPGIVGIE